MLPLSSFSVVSGKPVPILGQGTWFMGESRYHKKREVNVLRAGVERGLTLIDTAEMYANGGAERIVAEAVTGLRDKVFIISKVLPNNASYQGTLIACHNSLRRLNTDFIDLYLLHWRGNIALHDTIRALQQLKQEGKIRNWGVSNFDLADLIELSQYTAIENIASNQVLYNLRRRGIEFDLHPWCQQQHIPIMAYSPLEQGRILKHTVLNQIAQRHQATAAQIALNWLLLQPNTLTIPKMARLEHLEENHQALTIQLTSRDILELNNAFPTPHTKIPLQML